MKRTILVTRPASQGIELTTKLSLLGFDVKHIPVLAIKPLQDEPSIQAIKKSFSIINSYDAFIIVSINSAEQALAWFKEYPYKPESLFFSVGLSTARFLQEQFTNIKSENIIYPTQDMNSEGLLALPELHTEKIKNKSFLLLRGIGGRELIASTLNERGAKVDSLALYQRELPTENTATLQECFPRADIVIINSIDSLKNLLTLLSPLPTLADKTLVVPSERVALHAQSLGFQHIITAANATNQAVIAALTDNCLFD